MDKLKSRKLWTTLFSIGAELATPATSGNAKPESSISPEQIVELERWIDEAEAVNGPIRDFILPGGHLVAAQLHVCRTVCRRAEREATTLARQEGTGANVLSYLNRLSDALFVMARYENYQRNVAEPLWQPGA